MMAKVSSGAGGASSKAASDSSRVSSRSAADGSPWTISGVPAGTAPVSAITGRNSASATMAPGSECSRM